MIFKPLAHGTKQFIHRNSIAQCNKCLQTSSYDLQDEILQRPLMCQCGGDLRLFDTGQRKGAKAA